MRIRVSARGRGPKIYTEHQIAAFEHDLTQATLDSMSEFTAGVSELRLSKLVAEVDRRVKNETKGLFSKAVQIIDRSRSYTARNLKSPGARGLEVPGFDSSSLGGGGAINAFAGAIGGGGVNWEDLSKGWAEKKLRTRPDTARKFFIYTGSLRKWLNNPGYAISKFYQFGGVDITRKSLGAFQKRNLTRGDPELVLSHLEIRVFSSIPASLLPMLASYRWTDHSEGMFEERMLGGAVGMKLAGPPGRHRPLFQPLLQFWLAYRIPNVVGAAIRSVMKA